mmetsp:Transcript_28564/g.61730  ORF Transcript_28564/g.61730 Transcript_28564/m.61730 type:complete len:248 (+) Transcript_28564:631-1374(+)
MLGSWLVCCGGAACDCPPQAICMPSPDDMGMPMSDDPADAVYGLGSEGADDGNRKFMGSSLFRKSARTAARRTSLEKSCSSSPSAVELVSSGALPATTSSIWGAPRSAPPPTTPGMTPVAIPWCPAGARARAGLGCCDMAPLGCLAGAGATPPMGMGPRREAGLGMVVVIECCGVGRGCVGERTNVSTRRRRTAGERRRKVRSRESAKPSSKCRHSSRWRGAHCRVSDTETWMGSAMTRRLAPRLGC